MIKKCPGCGSVIQYTDKEKIGYSPKKDAKLCERCFKLKNYNQKQVIDLKYDNENIIKLLNDKADNVLFVTDFLNLSFNVINTFNKINVQNKTLVINKTDYIPKSINKDKYITWIKDTYNIANDIVLVSASKSYNIRVINNLIIEKKHNYICGFTNSGKSTIINKLCELNEKDSSILTSLMPNTTLDIIKIKLDDDKYIYDTPGFTNNFLFDEKLYPKKFLKPITLQIKKNDVVLIDNKIYLRFDNSTSITFYMSNDVLIKKVYDDTIKFDNEIKLEENTELLIHGYGFINNKKSCVIKTNIEKSLVEVRTSMF